MKSSLGNLTLYKFDAPFETDVGVTIQSSQNGSVTGRFQLIQFTGRKQQRGSKGGLSKQFVYMVETSVSPLENTTSLTNQIFDYIVANFSFKDLDFVPPSSPVLVFHFQVRTLGEGSLRELDMASLVLRILRTKNSILGEEDAKTRLVPIVSLNTEILDCYESEELCFLCGEGYPKEDEIAHKTKCNHIFHGNCISRYLVKAHQCPICSAPLPPVDIRSLLFD